jgi:hypothetical protein
MLGAMNFVGRVSAVVVAVALATGCGGSVTSDSATGGSPGGGSPATGGPTAAEFPAQLEQLACDTLEPCCSVAQLPFDRIACLKAFNVRAVASGEGIAFDSAAAQRCLDEFKRATHDCSAFDKSQLPDCNLLTQGTLPLGAACTSSRQCAATPSGAITCYFEASATTGRCSLVETGAHAARGEGCDATCLADGNCEVGASPVGSPLPSGDCYVTDGLYCDTQKQRCERIGNSGDTCSASDGCASGLVCVGLVDQYTTGTGELRPGTCGPPQSEGAPCGSSEECVTLACDSGTGFCAHVPLATAGLCLGLLPGAD